MKKCSNKGCYLFYYLKGTHDYDPYWCFFLNKNHEHGLQQVHAAALDFETEPLHTLSAKHEVKYDDYNENSMP